MPARYAPFARAADLVLSSLFLALIGTILRRFLAIGRHLEYLLQIQGSWVLECELERARNLRVAQLRRVAEVLLGGCRRARRVRDR